MKRTLLAIAASVLLAGATVAATETAAEAKTSVQFKVFIGTHHHHHRHCHKVWVKRHHHWVRIRVCHIHKW